ASGLSPSPLAPALVVGIELVAGGARRLEQCIIERVLIGYLRHIQRTANATAIGGTFLVVLNASEQRRHLLPAPAACAHLRPGVIIERLATYPHQAVNRARPPQQLPARNANCPLCPP